MVNSNDRSEFDIYDLTWNIPASYGGMTSAMLSRTEQFERFGMSKRITLLTLAAGLNVAETEDAVRDRWGISKNVAVRNIWQDLRTLDAESLKRIPGEIPSEIRPAEIHPNATEEVPFMHVIKDIEGNAIFRQHVRDDGTLVLSDDLNHADGRRLTLFDNEGNATKMWRGGSDLYLSWLNFVIADRRSVLINEDKRIGEFLHRFSNENCKVIQVVHGTHLANRSLAPYGPLLKLRTSTLKNLTEFDRVTVLTQSQYDDIAALGLDMSNVAIMPNATSPRDLEHANKLSRPEGKGAIVGKLTPLKRVDHAVKAIAGCHASALGVSLDVYGDGPVKESLEALIASFDETSSQAISLKGHVKDAAALLSEYSFLLMTSTTEGQSLVLLEAMSQGCVPIAYNIRYGPSDLIVDGVNGFLVQPGDIEALGRTIRHFVSLPEKIKSNMRKAAAESVRKYYPAENMRRWAELFGGLWDEVPVRRGLPSDFLAEASAVKLQGSELEITGQLVNCDGETLPELCLISTTRDAASFVKSPVALTGITNRDVTFKASMDLRKLPTGDKAVLDFYISPVRASWIDKSRVKLNFRSSGEAPYAVKVYETKHSGFSVDLKR